MDNSFKSNNFDLLRFLLAFVVFLVHASYLSASDQLTFIQKTLSSELAVKGFFVVSGFLIFMSYENSRTLVDYFSKRLRRIYPAYLFVILSSTLIGAFLTSVSINQYIGYDLFKFIFCNLSFLNFLAPNLPGLFEQNKEIAVNGALWTLKIEVMFYLSVPIIVFLSRRFGLITTFLSLYILSLIYSLLLAHFSSNGGDPILIEMQRQLPGQLTYFIVGAAGYYYSQFFLKHGLLIAFIAALILWSKQLMLSIVFEPVMIGLIIILVAIKLPCLGRFSKYGDISYGIYIIHFPILQVFVALGLFEHSPSSALMLATVAILLMAFLLWHYIERPFLKRSSHYVLENN